jgi:hypothetical protein
MCQPHYLKWLRHGDALAGKPVIYWQPVADEIWLDCPGFEGVYMVSNFGRVWSVPRPFTAGGYMALTPMGQKQAGKRKYLKVSFSKDSVRTYHSVHSLVMRAFAGPVPPGMEILHLNDIGTDNRWPQNLIYGTHAQNQAMMAANNGSHFKDRVDVTVFGEVAALWLRRYG